jgi:hypothetical protein
MAMRSANKPARYENGKRSCILDGTDLTTAWRNGKQSFGQAAKGAVAG